MATFEARSIQYSLILDGVKNGEISSLFWKLERCVAPAKALRNGKLLTGEGEFLIHVLKYIHHYLSVRRDRDLTEKDLLSTFQSVEFCINLFEKHYDFQEIQQICEGQYEKTLYHIIHHLISRNHEHAFLLIIRFKDYVQRSLKIAVGSLLFTYTTNLFSAIWNYLGKHEKLGANEIFEKRLLALQILSYNSKQLYTFGENSYYAIRMYCKTGKPEHQLVSCFLQSIWSNIHEYKQECSEICVKKLMLRTTCRWLAATYDKLIDKILPDFLAIFDFLKTLTQEHKCSHSILVDTISDIAVFCATFIPLKETINIPDSTLTFWETQLKNHKGTAEDLKYIASVFSVFVALLEKLLKLMSNTEKVSNCHIVKCNLNILVCISGIYFEYLDTGLNPSVPDNRGYVITAMLQIIYNILLQENSANDILNLFSFANLFAEKFDLVCMNKKSQNNGLEGYVITLGKIAHHFMQSYSYKEAAECLKFVIRGCESLVTEYTETCLSNIDCWKYHKLLVICYESMGLYNDALKVLVEGFILKNEIEPSDFEFWLKVKKNAYLANCEEVIKKTVTDIFEEINATVTQAKQIILLENELWAIKKEKRYECIAEAASVILQIMRSTSDSHTKALMLVELSQIGGIELSDYCPDVDKNSTPLSLCQQASQILQHELKSNPDNIFCKIRLSYSCFWMYVCKINEVQTATSEKVEKESNEARKCRKGSAMESNGHEKECDIKPAFFNMTTAFENKLFENLNEAIDLWKEIVHDLNKEPVSIDNEVEKLNLLEVILTSAEIFWTSGNENQAIISWSLLHEIASYCHNNVYKLISLSSIASLAISQGYLDLAGELIDLAEKLVSSLPERKSSNCAKFSLDCCKSVYFLHRENFTEGLKLLVCILESQTLKQKTRKHLILKFETKLVLAQYMLLNRSVFTENILNSQAIPRDPVTLVNRCAIEYQQFLKITSNEESRSLSWISSKLKITRLLFQNAVFESQLFLDMGSPCKAKFLLSEAIYMAQFLFHTYWASKLLIISSYVDLVCSDYKSCEVKLTGLEYILKTKEETNCTDIKTPASNQLLDSDEELDDSFLTTRSDIDFKTEVRLDFIKKFQVMSLSPATHNRQRTVKSEIKNPFTCSCEQCLLCSVKFISLELGLLKCCYLMEKELQFDVTLQFSQLQDFLSQLTKSHTAIEKLLLFKDYQIANELFSKSMPKSHLAFLIKVMLKQAVCNYKIKRVEHAMKDIHEAEGLLQKYAKTPTMSCPNLFALITVHKVELCLKFFTVQTLVSQSKSFSKFSTVPISLNSEIYSTPECKKIPPINVANCFNKPTYVSLSNAPVKKCVLPADVKHGLDNNSPFTIPNFQSPSVLNLMHSVGESKAFISPLNLYSNDTAQQVEIKTYRRIRSTRSTCTLPLKRMENEEKSVRTKNYKFFTSKSQDTTSITAARDVWSSAQTLDSVFTLECSTPSKKSNRRNAKRNPPLKTQKTRVKTQSKAGSQRSNSNSSPNENKIIESKIPEDSIEQPFDTSAELFCSPTFLLDAIEETRKNPKSRVNKTASTRLNKKGASICKTPSLDSTKKQVCSSRSRGKLLSVEMTLAENSESRTRTLKKNVETFKSVYTSENSYDIASKLNNRVRKDEMILHGLTPKEVSEKFINIFQRDWNIDELIMSLKSSIAAIEHRPPHPLYSELCKMLALLMMLNAKASKNNVLLPFDVAYLLSESFAVTLRSENVICLDKKTETNMSQTNEPSSKPKMPYSTTNSCATTLNEMNFQLSRCNMFSDKMQYLMNHLPVEWTVVQVCAIKDSFLFGAESKQNLCICRYRRDATPYIKLLNLDNCDLKTYFSEFDAIRHENTVSTKSKDPEQFWKLRMNLNHRLKVFVADMCSNWFGGWKGLFLGLPATQKRKDRIQEIIKKLPLPLPQINDQEMLEVLVDTAHSLNNEELSSVIDELWKTENDDDMHDSIFKFIRTETANFKDVARHPVILILDKDLQYLPWESMPINRSYPTVREPSLYFLHYQLLCHNQDTSLVSRGVDSNSTFYLLNPQGDMMRTQECFQEIFSREMTSWTGITGKVPTPEEMQHAFTDHELVLYLGHGSGNYYFRNSYEVETLNCTASAVVMGCSSGSLEKSGPQMEATGDALRYYLGGCPCIVANLWEVTDKDIDLYTKSLLESWLPNYNGKNTAKDKKSNIAAVAAKARNACKLRYLNGAAPIVYGLPLFAKF